MNAIRHTETSMTPFEETDRETSELPEPIFPQSFFRSGAFQAHETVQPSLYLPGPAPPLRPSLRKRSLRNLQPDISGGIALENPVIVLSPEWLPL